MSSKFEVRSSKFFETSEDLGANAWQGTVVAVQANFYRVRLVGEEPRELLCTRRARLKKLGQTVRVGDRVTVEEIDWADKRGAIAQVSARETELDRPPIANASQLLLVFALADPPLDPYQLSRFLVKAETTGLALVVALNKSDLAADSELEAWRDRLRSWGYDPVFLSALQGSGLADLERQLAGEITVLAGPSGVGKSSLIDRAIPEARLRVGEVSGKLRRGRHTTRHVELFELPGGGLLADTPGFNQPDLDVEPEQLAFYFPEARERLAAGECQFSDCWHRDEPNCQVRGDWERYSHYLRFLEVAIARQEARQATPDAEATLKRKSKGAGQQDYEPKLASKKYRRTSRRQHHQNLQALHEEAEEQLRSEL